MADISMCGGEGCDRRQRCHRFTAIPNPFRQSYLVPKTPGDQCEHFWNNDDASQQGERHADTTPVRLP